ncbi:hypothetical protein KIL84_013720 [Mauremys mutica]|uniref:Uncharacterized protein n=1 Tax=Mauremys mutica TaxID=74926 RepID=A0A9D3WY64_9SAUR|nr:hypothetical protein KIL84_013720 [Mauremys mutica]
MAGPRARQWPRKGCWDRKRRVRNSTTCAAAKRAEQRPRDLDAILTPGGIAHRYFTTRSYSSLCAGQALPGPTKDGGSERAPA